MKARCDEARLTRDERACAGVSGRLLQTLVPLLGQSGNAARPAADGEPQIDLVREHSEVVARPGRSWEGCSRASCSWAGLNATARDAPRSGQVSPAGSRSRTIGTDGNGGSYVDLELENQVLAGIPVWEVLRMVTSGNAELMDLKETGRMATGYEVDIAFLRADPLADGRNVAAVAFVVNNGTLHSRGDLLQVAREIAVQARIDSAPGER